MKRSAMGIFISISFLFSGVLVILTLLSSIALTTENDRFSAYDNELKELESENIRLSLSAEGKISLNDLEKIARDELDMLPPDQLQIYYIAMQP